MTLTRATLGKIATRATKTIDIVGNKVKIQRPTPLEFSQYQSTLIDKDGKAIISNFADAILLLVARMWIDGEGVRLFRDSETKELGSIDLTFYQALSAESQSFAQTNEASKTLGESEQTTDCDLLVESV